MNYEESLEYLKPMFYYEGDSLDKVSERWDLTGLLPIPKWNLKCDQCGKTHEDGAIQLRSWSFAVVPWGKSKNTHRCDVSFKCRECSLIFYYGVVIPDSMAQKHYVKTYYRWREGYELLYGGVTETMPDKLQEIVSLTKKNP